MPTQTANKPGPKKGANTTEKSDKAQKPAEDPKDLQKTSESAVVKPAKAQRGMEDFDNADLIVPRALLMQPGSPQVQDDDIECAVCDVLNNITNANYGTEVTIIPIIFRKKRIKWLPMDDGGGMECASMASGRGRFPDTGECFSSTCKSCEFAKWGPDNTPPLCDEIFEFLAMVVDEGLNADNVMQNILAFGFTRTSAAAGIRIGNLARFAGGDLFSRQYVLTTEKKKEGKFTWAEFRAEAGGSSPDELYKLAEYVYETLISEGFEIHEEDVPAVSAEEEVPF